MWKMKNMEEWGEKVRENEKGVVTEILKKWIVIKKCRLDLFESVV